MPQSTTGLLAFEESRLDQSGQSLCMSCGLCCDGTLFGQVHLTPEDQSATLSARVLQIAFRHPPAFKQPCMAYKNCLCGIYAERPHNCRKFQCGVLKRFTASELSYAEASEIIREAVTARDEVSEKMLATFGEYGCTLENFTTRLKTRWENATSIEAKDEVTDIFRKFAALWLCINQNFRKGWLR